MKIISNAFPYLYIDDQEKFNETLLLSEKEQFYSNSSTEDTTDADFMHTKRL